MASNRPAGSVPAASSTPAASSAAASSSSSTQGQAEYVVRMSRDKTKKFSIMKFNADTKVDFSTMAPVVLQRENNFKDFKTAHNMDAMPKFGAGSEFGRDFKDEARRKKYGITLRKYNPDDQPWLMKIGPGKAAKKFRGIREGGVAENTSYFLFMQSPDGAFEACPVDNWYQFSPVITYKCLNAEEAEEEFSRRDKTFNMFSIMMKRRLKTEEGGAAGDDGGGDDEDDKSKVKLAKKKQKNFMLTEMEDWAEMSDEDDDKDESDGGEDKKEKKPKAAAKGKGDKAEKKRPKKTKGNDSDDEAVEDSDDGDDDDREVDYMSDTSESDSDAEERAKKIKYEEKGVEDEDGLRGLVGSDEEEDEEDKDKIKSEVTTATGAENEEEKENSKGPPSSSSSSSSESDSDDPDQADNEFTKAFLMMGGKKADKMKSAGGSRPSTPSESRKRKTDANGKVDATDVTTAVTSSMASSKKLKLEDAAVGAAAAALHRPMTPTPGTAAKPATPGSSSKSEGVSEEALRRYLIRKPMTTKDLLQKFRSKKTGLSNEDLVHFVVGTLKKLKPEQQKINNTIYWTIKNA